MDHDQRRRLSADSLSLDAATRPGRRPATGLRTGEPMDEPFWEPGTPEAERRRPSRRWIAIAVAGVVVAAVVATGLVLAAGDDDESTSAAGQGRDATTTTTDDATTATSGSGATTDGEGDGSGDDGSGADGGSGDDDGSSPTTADDSSGNGDDGVVASAPRPGEYVYDLSQRDASGTIENELRLTVVTDSTQGGTLEQTHETDLLGGVLRDRISWSQSGALVRSTTTAADPAPCEFEPPFVELVFPLVVGASWVGDSQCETSFDDQPATLSWHQESEVTEVSTAVVGGRTITVWIIERTRLVSFDGEATSGSSQSTIRDEFAPDHGLVVRSTIEERTEGDTVTYEKVLRSLTPS
jgi:hypothetical protein